MSDQPHTDRSADSAGIPWAGRDLGAPASGGDSGQGDEALLSALRTAIAHPSVDADLALFGAARQARWLVPVVAVRTESDATTHADTSTDMAVVTLTRPDGRRAMPAFTSVDALAGWDATARPVPVGAERLAESAIAEGCEVVVVDLESDHVTELRPSMVWALSQHTYWIPSPTDPFVAQSVSRALADERAVVSHRLEDGDPAGAGILRVALQLRPGLDTTQVHALATRVAERLATDGEFRARVDELTFTIERAIVG